MNLAWIDTDPQGRIAAVYQQRQAHHRPTDGVADTPAFRATHARRDDAEFRRIVSDDRLAIAAEKFARLPRAERLRQVREEFAAELAEADHALADPTADESDRLKARALYNRINERVGK